MKMFFKNNKENIIIFSIPFIIFCILLVTFFPGIVTYDSNVQWLEVQSGLINDAHPFFTTYFMYLLSKIWNNIAIVSLVQVLFFSISWTYFCNLLRKYNKKSKHIFKIQILVTIFISLLPIISIYSITIWKDILYSYYLMLIVFLIYKGIKENFVYSRFEYAYFGFLLAMVYQYRHNGKIVAVLFILLILIFLFKKRITIKNSILIIGIFASINLLILIPKTYFLNEYNESIKIQEKSKEDEDTSKASISTIDSYIIWMYGSFVKDNVVDDKNTLNKLDKVIPIEDWKDVYDPYLVNSTGFYEKDGAYYNENLNYFRKTFLKLCLKHPLTIIKHYLKADALLWCPLDVGYVYAFDYTDWRPKYEFNNAKQYNYDELSFKLPIVKKVTEKYTSFGLYFPMRLFYRPINVLLLTALCLFLLIKQNKKKIYWMLLIPAIFNTISLLPINLAQDLRYVYINYLTLITVLLLFFCEYDFSKIKNKIKKIKK